MLFHSESEWFFVKVLIANACVLAAVLALLIVLLVRTGDPSAPSTPKGDDVTTTVVTNTTTTAKKPTASTTRMPTRPSTSSEASSVLVNTPITGEMAQDALTQIKELCSASGGRVSFMYIDLETGYSIEHRADRSYQAASVIKAPYVKWLLSSGVDGAEKLTMTASDKQGGSGIIDKEAAGTQFTVNQLMEYAIRYSDNTAYYLLNKRFGFKDFNAYAETLGITANKAGNCTLSFPRPRFGYLSARDIALYMEDIAKYIASGSESAKKLKTWMMSSSEERQLTDAFSSKNVLYGAQGNAPVDYHHDVAHKYGDTKNIENAFHDGAIVFADKTFVLAVATSLEPFTTESVEVFHELAFQINKIHYALHAG